MWKKLTRNLDDLPKPEMDLLRKTFARVDVNEDRFSSQPSVMFFRFKYTMEQRNFDSFAFQENLHIRPLSRLRDRQV